MKIKRYCVCHRPIMERAFVTGCNHTYFRSQKKASAFAVTMALDGHVVSLFAMCPRRMRPISVLHRFPAEARCFKLWWETQKEWDSEIRS